MEVVPQQFVDSFRGLVSISNCSSSNNNSSSIESIVLCTYVGVFVRNTVVVFFNLESDDDSFTSNCVLLSPVCYCAKNPKPSGYQLHFRTRTFDLLYTTKQSEPTTPMKCTASSRSTINNSFNY
mmetsp:Transcript_6212/g.6140  ORF Transcript_6212/g.6140 Transcript_6212/m.6140 type:complete len:124 (+) Transcript_6212:1043-1414(+)